MPVDVYVLDLDGLRKILGSEKKSEAELEAEFEDAKLKTVNHITEGLAKLGGAIIGTELSEESYRQYLTAMVAFAMAGDLYPRDSKLAKEHAETTKQGIEHNWPPLAEALDVVRNAIALGAKSWKKHLEEGGE